MFEFMVNMWVYFLNIGFTELNRSNYMTSMCIGLVLNLLGLLNILVIVDGNVANLKWCKDPDALVDVYETKEIWVLVVT